MKFFDSKSTHFLSDRVKKPFYKNVVEDLKIKHPSQCYSAVMIMVSCENKSEQLLVDEMNHLSNKAQCELIADEFANILHSTHRT